MKSIQRFILPFLVIAAIALIYFTYFSPKKGLGSFSDFDANNTANKDIIVKVLSERGINKDHQKGTTTFFAVDSNGTEMLIQAPINVPVNIETAERIILRGHLHPDHFHAIDVQLQ